MRWPNTYRHDPRQIIDNKNVYFQVIARNKVKMLAGGSPCTYWKNTSLDEFGVFNTSATRCWCYSTSSNQPNPRHALCMGTGVLSGYQKYGYDEEVFASPSLGTMLVKNSNIQVSSTDFSISISGNVTDVEILSAPIVLKGVKEFDRLLVSDQCDTTNNNIEYYYSFDNLTWTKMSFVSYSTTDLANKSAVKFTIPASAEKIWFKIKLRKRIVAASSPIFHSMRFRYRTMLTLRSIAGRYKIDEPAFLASREQQKVIVEGGDQGWETKYPLTWWVLPEVNISTNDIIQFYNGLYKGRKFYISWLERRLVGPEMMQTSTSFETKFIRDNNDLMGILSYLS